MQCAQSPLIYGYLLKRYGKFILHHHTIPIREVVGTTRIHFFIFKVPSKKLPAALLNFQRTGYTIIAIEQTEKSKPLYDFVFPEKSVLVLGAEKEGVSAEILSIVDVCLEIPQKGVTRSLNVHIAGALAMWQYTQQQVRGA